MTARPCQRLSNLVSSAPERAAALPADLADHATQCLSCQAEVHASRRLVEVLDGAMSDFRPSPFAAKRALATIDARKAEARRTDMRPVIVALGLVVVIVAAVRLGDSREAGDGATIVQFQAPEVEAPAGEAPTPGAVAPSSEATDLAAVPTDAPVEPAAGALQVAGCSADQPAPCAPGATLRTDRGERRTVTLSDETSLTLNHGTVLQLVAGEARTLELRTGDILLDVVAQGELPPLVIRVPTGIVRVIGTKLQISAGPDQSTVDVVRGVVEVETSGGSARLRAGREASLVAGKAPRVSAAADLAEIMRWSEIEAPEEEGSMGLGTLKARRPGARQDTEQALRLADHRVTIKVQGHIARTEIEEAFHNDTRHTMEGVYSFPLPPGARIAGLDLLVDGEWMQGAMVERDRGERIWRGVIRNATPQRQRQANIEYVWVPGPWRDPALLTWKGGSTFELRIFPIPARGERRVRIAYTETLPRVAGGRRYVYPLAADPSGAVRAERFALKASLGGVPAGAEVRATPYELDEDIDGNRRTLSAELRDFVPHGDLVLDIPTDPKAADSELTTWAYQAEGGDADAKAYGLLSLHPRLESVALDQAQADFDPGEMDVLFVVDTSYSMQQARLERAARLVSRVTSELDRHSRVHVLACATRCQAVGPGFRHASPAVGADLAKRLTAIEALGATRLGHAFERASAALRAARPTQRVIYIGDGVPSVGELEPAAIAKQVERTLEGVRLTTVSLGGEVDDVMLRAVARAGRGAYVPHGASAALRTTALRVLQRQWGEPLRDAELVLPEGVSEVAPAALGDVWPGEERLVAARLGAKVEGEVVLRGTLAGEPFERTWPVTLDPTADAGNAFLPRVWAERRIAHLQETGGERAEIVKLSTKHHVLSRHTSLLVLESEAMSKAFGVTATRPATEWTGEDEPLATAATGEVGGAGKVAETLDDVSADGMASGLMGSSGVGSGGGGQIQGLGRDGGTRSRAPRRERPVRAVTRASSPNVSGSMDRTAVQRVVRRHMSQIRATYERSLRSNPNLSGRLAVRFTIGPNGRVTQANATSTSLPSELTGQVTNVVRRWRFPPPEGGSSVTVTYPFVFSASGGGTSRPSAARPSPALPSLVPSRRTRGGSWVAMRKVWYREATIRDHRAEHSADRRELVKREERLAANPESRDRTRDLVRWHTRMGDLDAARTLAQHWLAKDRLDAGALVTLADLAALAGDMNRSRQLLASAVDADPRNPTAHERMMGLYGAADDAELRCAHALTRALVQPDERDAQVAAVRCGGDRERHLSRLSRRNRRRAERALRKAETAPAVRGPLKVTATWEGEADLDIVVVTPKGRRVSWQGGARRTRSEHATAEGRETLAMSTGEVGRYQIVILHRASDASAESEPITGSVRIRAHGKTRRISFTTQGGRAWIADVDVRSRWRRERVR